MFKQIFPVKKRIVFQSYTFSIWSLFILIRFELDRIVHDRLSIAVTLLRRQKKVYHEVKLESANVRVDLAEGVSADRRRWSG
jgi:hypothetical protein